MIWWKNTTPQKFYPDNNKLKYLTFEYDIGGWNNIRLALESVIIFAIITNRILVLPPQLHLYLLNAKASLLSDYITDSFFNNNCLKTITTEEFFNQLPDGIQLPEKVSLDLSNRSNTWQHNISNLHKWLRENSLILSFDEQTFFVFPEKIDNYRFNHLDPRFKQFKLGLQNTSHKMYIIGENELNAPILHFVGNGPRRLIAYHTSKIYMESFDAHKYVRSFLRDYFRYNKDIFRWAKYITDKLDNLSTIWYSAHIRRGDFQFTETRISCEEILKSFSLRIPEGSTIYISTDETDKSFFSLLKEKYTLYFFDDFITTEIINKENINPNWIGMIEQVTASYGEEFFGTFLSTFTHYILRMRGYMGKYKSWYTNYNVYNYYQENSEKFICTWQHEYRDVWEDVD